MRHAPNGAVLIIGEQQRAIFGLGDADGPTPDPPILSYEAGNKILVFAGGHAILHDATNDLIAGAFCSVP